MDTKSLSISVKQRLSNYARKNNLNYYNVATSFLLERLVARLTSEPNLYKSLVFKGGYVGLRIYESTRYTIDLDALLTNAGLKETLTATRQAAEKDLEDAVWFRYEKEVDLKTQGEYGGIRQIYRAGIGEAPKKLNKSQIIHFDLGIGDPVTPQAIESQTSELIGQNELSWKVYPIESMIAEKIHALIDRGEFSSRSKDIFDLALLLPKAEKTELKNALKACFEFRETPLPKNFVKHIKSINTHRLKMGWASAVSAIKDPPTFEESYNKFIDELGLLLK